VIHIRHLQRLIVWNSLADESLERIAGRGSKSRRLLLALRWITAVSITGVIVACTGQLIRNPPGKSVPPGDAPTNVTLDRRAVLISEEAFRTLISAQMPAASSVEVRHVAAETAAMVGDPFASGVVARLRSGPRQVKSDLFVVVRDPVLASGEVRAQDVSVVAMSLAGKVPWSGEEVGVTLVRQEAFGGSCQARSRGCRPISSLSVSAATGLSPRTLLNLEAGPASRNASGMRPRLVVLGGSEANTMLSYECRAPVEWDTCNELPWQPEAAKPEIAQSLKLPDEAIVLSERDFLAAMQNRDYRPGQDLDSRNVRRLLTAANSDEALGVGGRLVSESSFKGNFFVVMRNAILGRNGEISAHDYFFAAVNLSGRASWLARGAELQFRDRVPTLSDGVCGLAVSTTDLPKCDHEPCGPVLVPLDGGPPFFGFPDACTDPRQQGVNVTVDTSNPYVAGDRWPAGNRVTLRVPRALDRDGLPAGQVFSAVACSAYLPPPPRIPNPGGCGNNEVEVCNGRDDDCDGDVDEGNVCAYRNTQCPCVPVSCGAVGATCGTIPDGCGQVLTCGPACN
jgi:hypothetical protein